jgi:hypothetical protein
LAIRQHCESSAHTPASVIASLTAFSKLSSSGLETCQIRPFGDFRVISRFGRGNSHSIRMAIGRWIGMAKPASSAAWRTNSPTIAL